MMWRILLPVFTLFVFRGDASETPTQIFKGLMQNYNRNEAPGFPDKSTEVKVGIYVSSMEFVGDKSLDFTITFYLRQSWKDPRLRFSSPDGQTKSILSPENSWNEIWRPDTFIRNSLSVKISDDLSSNRLIRVGSDGAVFYSGKVTAVLPCHFNLRRYPFDKQQLDLMFESYGYTMQTLHFSTLEHPVDIGSVGTLSTFNVINATTEDCSMNYTSGAYTCLRISITLQRNAGPFVFKYYLPSIIFVVVSWLSFWTDPETSSVSRPLTGILALIALVLLHALASYSAFLATYVTALDIWMFVCYLFVFAALVEYAVVSVLSKKPSAARGCDYCLKPPFAGTEKAIEASEKPGDGSSADGKRKSRLVDWFSRICFPIAFILFNLIYWIANA